MGGGYLDVLKGSMRFLLVPPSWMLACTSRMGGPMLLYRLLESGAQP